MKETIISFISVLLGFISGLLVPWVKWEVEKRRERHEYRKNLIKDWREKLTAADFYSSEGRDDFGNSAEYSSLRLQMTKETIQAFEAPRTLYVGGGRGEDVRKQMLLDEVAQLEKKWGLS